MLLKAAILHRGGKIRERYAKQTFGFDACIRKALSDGKLKFLTEEQALTLQIINSLRDAAQHHLVDISEQQLYLHAQSGLTLFRDLLKAVFLQDLANEIPTRVLPISTTPPADLATLFDNEVKAIKQLLQPRKRHRIEALAKLRPLAILDASIQGKRVQPEQQDLKKLSEQVQGGKNWYDLFPGVASIDLTTEGDGHAIELRISKKEGIPTQLVPEGTLGATVVAVKRVNELGYYNMGRDQLANNIGLTGPKTTAVIWHLNLRSEPECCKEFTIGKTKFTRYSQKAISRIKEALKETSINEIWLKYVSQRKKV